MERFGCTTPFGLELDKICTGQNESLEANGFFWEILDRQITQCPYPCHFLMKQITPTNYDCSLMIYPLDQLKPKTKTKN